MISTFTKLQLMMAANKYGVQIKTFEEGLVEVYINNWNLLEQSLSNIISDLERDPDIHYVSYIQDENTMTISYNHEAIVSNRAIERWLTIFQKYYKFDSPS